MFTPDEEAIYNMALSYCLQRPFHSARKTLFAEVTKNINKFSPAACAHMANRIVEAKLDAYKVKEEWLKFKFTLLSYCHSRGL